MEDTKVVVAGAGVLGAQIAVQIAGKGFDVCIYEIESGLDYADKLLKHYRKVYLDKIAYKREHPEFACRGIYPTDVTPEELDNIEATFIEGVSRMKITTNPEEAFRDADYVIEAVSERTEIKTEFYTMIDPLLKDDAIVLTNTSTLLPSTFAPCLKHPERFLAFHFLNAIWSSNLVEVMPHQGGEGFPATDPEVIRQTMVFGEKIGMIPVELKKEHARHVYNTLLTPQLEKALELLVDGIADCETIDYIWSIAGNRPTRPFRSIDYVGINTMYNCLEENPASHDPEQPEYRTKALLKSMIDEGRLGFNSGHGFYDYV